MIEIPWIVPHVNNQAWNSKKKKKKKNLTNKQHKDKGATNEDECQV